MKLKVTDLNSPDKTTEGIRLQLYMSRSGVASRRACEKIILDGRVTVNGILEQTLGTRVLETDSICVDGVLILLESKKRYVLLNKPSGYVCSLSDEKGRPVAADLLTDKYKERLYHVGRLDMYSSGALIFTNDGEFAAYLGHPSSGVEKQYIVEASMPFRDDVITAFKQGIRIDSVYYKCRDAQRLSSRRLTVTLVEGKNREIRRVLEHFSIRVKNLIRTRIGQISIEGLEYGESRDLTVKEIESLQQAQQTGGDGDNCD